LIPFSLLVAMGSHLAWPRSWMGTPSGLYFAMEKVGQPFTQPATPLTSGLAHAKAAFGLIPVLPTLLAAVWICGFMIVLSVWCVRWRRISAAIREAEPLREGREVEALRRAESIGGVRQHIPILLSSGSLEPGIFGISRPVLVWPKGISERLDIAHLEAIVAHEVWHVRRRDNLAAAIHMVVEALFWFHPLVWWLGSRLVEERERSCDEEVLEFGSDRLVYAESILKVCEFCVGSPLACVSGVTGSDLKKRMEHIMCDTSAHRLSAGRKALLLAIGSTAIAVPVVVGLVDGPPLVIAQSLRPADEPLPSFEVASVKPSRPDGNGVRLGLDLPRSFTTRNATVEMLIESVYNLQTDNQLSGAPSWINSTKYDIDARIEHSQADELQRLPPDEVENLVKSMVRSLLADRFKLRVSHVTKQLPVYALVIAEGGPKLNPPADPTGGSRIGRMARGQFSGTNASMRNLVNELAPEVGRTVIDKTGLTGKYDWTLRWTPMLIGREQSQPGIDAAPPDVFESPLFTAVQEQLGLKLEPQEAPVEILVIGHVERPSDN
jgi:bla regulator protein BlaR1